MCRPINDQYLFRCYFDSSRQEVTGKNGSLMLSSGVRLIAKKRLQISRRR
jgi:hypothetical protein